MRESNPRHPGCKPGALASELIALVEPAGVEPASSCLQGRRNPVIPQPLVDKTTTLSGGLFLM